MKTLILRLSSLVARHSSLVAALALAAASAGAATPGAVTPYTFIGRVMDSQHAAFDTNRVCTLSASDASSGELLARTETFFRPNSRRNYALKIPVATSEANGYAVQGRLLSVSAVDDVGKTWTGVISDPVCGEAGGIREVDIVLGVDRNGDGIDDSLFDRLRIQWEASDYWEYGAEFDPYEDYDGDGVSTISEAYAGTNPFNPEDVLRIVDIAVNVRSPLVAMSFATVPARAYSVETATAPDADTWTPAPFVLSPADEDIDDVLAVPSNTGTAVSTVYLLPTAETTAFFRIAVK